MTGTEPSHSQRWVVLRTAPDQLTAELWRGLLDTEDIPSMLAPGDAVSYLGLSPIPCRVLVPEVYLAMAELALENELWSAEGTDEDANA